MVVIGKSPKGGLIFETSDNAFAYWLTSFAGSPLPSVILEFRNGSLRPNSNLMKKPAPSLTVLRNKARVARQQIGLEPYTGVDSSSFDTAFWDVMLDLIYTGHEDLAWQYLDLVWDARKTGKQLFVRDFKQQLTDSQYWQMIEEDKNSRK